MNKITVAAIIILLAAFGGLVAWGVLSTNGGDLDKIDTTKIIEAQELNGNIGDHVRGKEDSKVVVVEYADFQCEYCALMMPKAKTVFEKYGDRVAFVFRNYNLSYHNNARSSSAAAEAAGKQGYFWEMAEMIFDRQDEWKYYTNTEERTNYFASLFEEASEGKGNKEQFANDLNDKDISKKIDFDLKIAKQRDHISETPTFFVNGEKLESTSLDEDGLSKLIEKKLEETK